ncbi:MAG: hypothetical protein ACAF41_18170 [Leptolyngbya sp. BL-A-14]
MPRNRQARLHLRACIFTLGHFSIDDLHTAAGVSRSLAQRYVKDLLNEGVLKIIHYRRNGSQDENVYQLIQAVPVPDWKKVQSSRYQIWSAIRILQTFRLPDLHINSEIAKSSIKKYVRYLLQTGYLEIIEPRLNGSKSYNLYLLIRNSGPLAPIVRRNHTVFDPNSKETYSLK